MLVAPAPTSAAILLVEDDPDAAALLRDLLSPVGYRLQHAMTAAEALGVVQNAHALPDLIILDLNLPDEDGLVLCADLKARLDAPIIICSGVAERRERILALRLGADDVVSKPFDGEELKARIAAALRRVARQAEGVPGGPGGGVGAIRGMRFGGPVEAAGGTGGALVAPSGPPAPGAVEAEPDGVYQVGPLVVDPEHLAATLFGTPLDLTPAEYRLLRALARRPGEVLSREELAVEVKGYREVPLGRAIDLHVHRLREKLRAAEARALEAVNIVAATGQGYRLVAAPEV